MQRPVQIGRIGAEPANLRVVGIHHLAGLGVGIAGGRGLHRLLEPAVQASDQNPGMGHRLQGVPGDDHLRGRVRTELQMQAGNRLRDGRIGRRARGFCGPRPDKGAGRHPTQARGGQQPAPAELEIRLAILFAHGASLSDDHRRL